VLVSISSRRRPRGSSIGRVFRRHEPLQLLQPVLNDNDAGGGLVRGDVLLDFDDVRPMAVMVALERIRCRTGAATGAGDPLWHAGER